MILNSSHNCYNIVVMITTTILFLARPTTAFVRDTRIKQDDLSFGSVLGRNCNKFSLALAAGGFGKAPTGKSSSTKKKKSAKKQRNRSSTLRSPVYIPFHSVTGTYGDSREATRVLLDWLDEEEVEGLDDVEIGFSKQSGNEAGDPSPGLRGVFAKRDFRVGEYILAVPFVTTLLVDEDFDPSTSDPGTVLLRADDPEVGFRFWEKFFSLDDGIENSDRKKYKAFLECMPLKPDDPNFDGTPDFWTEEDIRRLEIPSLIDKMLSRKEAIARYAEKSFEINFVDKTGDDGADNGGMEMASSVHSTIQQCCWLVQSRAFTTYKKAMSLDGSVGLLSRVVMIPFIDMINHASRKFANSEMQVVETKEYDESFYALVATQTIRKGAEIKICYGTGEETSLEIFSKYGFWPEIENREREKKRLQKLLKAVDWSTTLEEDQAMLESEMGRREPMKTILS
eukprot:CAMPEP_0197193562 /NCGR_PEP_ID=MMETSP1423-20130617/27473_1 /TAXON_ID=476441 /ORGANISM="Pseudo-nitzschia heimii, Strain UNC1101" /LENGTH=452 /DNA_ID=CAMNT_0042646779 /DNA_START=39 /DNA_END=1394 /DNA_ORIENTATION=+